MGLEQVLVLCEHGVGCVCEQLMCGAPHKVGLVLLTVTADYM